MLEQASVVALFLVPLRRAWQHLALRPVANRVANGSLLLAERERVGANGIGLDGHHSIFLPDSSYA